jgi:hypothetical protein
MATARNHEQVEKIGDIMVEEVLNTFQMLDWPKCRIEGICPA